MSRHRLAALALVALAVSLVVGLQPPPAEANHGCCHNCLTAYYVCVADCGNAACEDACWNAYLACIPPCPRICPY